MTGGRVEEIVEWYDRRFLLEMPALLSGLLEVALLVLLKYFGELIFVLLMLLLRVVGELKLMLLWLGGGGELKLILLWLGGGGGDLMLILVLLLLLTPKLEMLLPLERVKSALSLPSKLSKTLNLLPKGGRLEILNEVLSLLLPS